VAREFGPVMKAESDDELYRVNPVWLGPPGATLPWRARYVAYGVWIGVFLALFTVARLVLMMPLSVWVVAWSVVIATVVTRVVCRRIDFERPLGTVLAAFGAELRGPRRRTVPERGVVGLAGVRGHTDRPRRRSA
jgi:hypothetical protein